MNEPVGYTLGVVFSRSTTEKPEPVMRLTVEQLATKQDIEMTRKAVSEGEKKLAKLMAGCAHPVFHDERGFIYDIRTCVICGAMIESL